MSRSKGVRGPTNDSSYLFQPRDPLYTPFAIIPCHFNNPMLTSDYTILKLRKAGVLTDQGLDLSALVSGTGFGDDQNAVTSFAIIWEIAKRYNENYRSMTDGRYVFESEDAWRSEAKWFAQEVMREWSGHELPWMEPVFAPGVPGVTRKPSDRRHQGQLPWMDKDAAYNIHLMVYFRIESGFLDDEDDIDPWISFRSVCIQSPQNIELGRYRPFDDIAFEIRIAPTNVRRSTTAGPSQYVEDGITFIYEPVKPIEERPEDLAWSAARDEKIMQGRDLDWISFLNANRESSEEARAISDGVHPDALCTHDPLIAPRLATLQEIFPGSKAWGQYRHASKESANPTSFNNVPGHSADMSASWSSDRTVITKTPQNEETKPSPDGSPASSRTAYSSSSQRNDLRRASPKMDAEDGVSSDPSKSVRVNLKAPSGIFASPLVEDIRTETGRESD